MLLERIPFFRLEESRKLLNICRQANKNQMEPDRVDIQDLGLAPPY